MKAITPVIATIVLLLITVAIAGSAWTYISGYWTGTTGKQIEVTDSFCVGTNQAKILVRNIGTDALNTADVKILNRSSGTDLTGDIQWASDVADSSLVLELKFDEGAGTVAGDTSGNGNGCRLYNGPAWTQGKKGGGLNFDGADDYINCGNATSLDLPSELTISEWVKLDSLASAPGPRLAVKMNTTSSNYDFLVQSGTNRLYIFFYYGGNQDHILSNANALSDLQWHHIVVTRNAARQINFYVDGVNFGSSTATFDMITNNNNLYIGAYYTLTTGFLDGTLDEVRIYNRALSPAEVSASHDNAVSLQPGGTGTITHTCGGRCDYRMLLGGVSKSVSVQC